MNMNQISLIGNEDILNQIIIQGIVFITWFMVRVFESVISKWTEQIIPDIKKLPSYIKKFFALLIRYAWPIGFIIYCIIFMEMGKLFVMNMCLYVNGFLFNMAYDIIKKWRDNFNEMLGMISDYKGVHTDLMHHMNQAENNIQYHQDVIMGLAENKKDKRSFKKFLKRKRIDSGDE
jgi:hypothetical protein